jgi:hypothetical protein
MILEVITSAVEAGMVTKSFTYDFRTKTWTKTGLSLLPVKNAQKPKIGKLYSTRNPNSL